MQKQEKAFTGWMNTLLLPYTPDFLKTKMEDEHAEALSSRRLTAQVRGILWKQYTRNESLIETMLKLEKRVDEGRLKLKEEVSCRPVVESAAACCLDHVDSVGGVG
jgi:hypothetical protein